MRSEQKQACRSSTVTFHEVLQVEPKIFMSLQCPSRSPTTEVCIPASGHTKCCSVHVVNTAASSFAIKQVGFCAYCLKASLLRGNPLGRVRSTVAKRKKKLTFYRWIYRRIPEKAAGRRLWSHYHVLCTPILKLFLRETFIFSMFYRS